MVRTKKDEVPALEELSAKDLEGISSGTQLSSDRRGTENGEPARRFVTGVVRIRSDATRPDTGILPAD